MEISIFSFIISIFVIYTIIEGTTLKSMPILAITLWSFPEYYQFIKYYMFISVFVRKFYLLSSEFTLELSRTLYTLVPFPNN